MLPEREESPQFLGVRKTGDFLGDFSAVPTLEAQYRQALQPMIWKTPSPPGYSHTKVHESAAKVQRNKS
jgi:hypothetical protein